MGMNKRQSGVSMFETILAIPILLFLGLGVLQWALVFQARYALTTALQDAARAGSVGFAQEQAIQAGFARGLVPYLYGASDIGTFQVNLVRAMGHIQLGQTQGFSRLRMLSPTNESFSDWARPARDAQGDLIPGLEEIPNDNLSGLPAKQVPIGGASGTRLGYSVGASSRQSLSDANMLKLELTYGVPLNVPFVGVLTVRALKVLNSCAGVSPVDACRFYDSVDENGQAIARLPLLVSAQVRMQTPARRSGFTVSNTAAVTSGDVLGAGQVGAASEFKASNLPAINAAQGLPDAIAPGQSGFLQFGADRAIQVPPNCTQK
jgi:TadE-like protein